MSRLTCRENVVVDQHIRRPACSFKEEIPGLLDRRTLDENKECRQAHGDVGGDDDEPQHGLHPSVGEAEEGQCEAGFGPHGSSQGEGAGGIDDFEHFDTDGRVRGHVPDVKAVAEADGVGEEAAFGRDADLGERP